MNYSKATLSAPTKEAIEADIRNLTWQGVSVYPNYPIDYEKSFGPFERFIVTPPRQEVITPAEYSQNGDLVNPPVLGNWICQLVLPSGYDTSHLNTLISNES